MKDGYVVCIGCNAIDEYYKLDSFPALGDKVRVEYMDAIPGGFIANVAAVAGTLGAECYMLDVLGTDQYTDMLLDTMKHNNIKTDYIEIEQGAANGKTMILMLGNEKTILLFKNNKRGPAYSDKNRALLRSARFIYSNINDLKKLGDYEAIVNDMTSQGADLFIDAETSTFQSRKSEKFFFCKSRIISLNEFALEKYCEGAGEKALDDLIEADPKKIIVITLGSKGCRILTAKERFSLDAYPVRPVDTTGAGDTFNGALMYGLLSGWDVRESAKFATAAAARSVLIQGPRAGAVPCSEVLRFIESGGKL